MTVNKANQYIKDTLKRFCDDYAPERAFEVKMPHVLFLDKEEFNSLSKLKICFNIELSLLRFAVINISSNYYFIIAGDRNLQCDNSEFLETNVSNVLFMGCVELLKLKVQSHINPYEIIDKIYEPEEGADEGYSVNILCDFFEPLKIYRIPEEIAQSQDSIMTALGKIIVNNLHLKILPFSESTLGSYNDFFDKGYFDYNVINSYLSYCWRYSFLDAYRCLEPIFRHIYLPQLKSELGIHASIDEIGESLDKHCGWRPQETGSMLQLFDENDTYISHDLVARFKALNIGGTNEKVGKLIYQLRNRIVHHQDKYIQIESHLDSEKWDKLIGCILDAIIELRIKFSY